MPKYHEQVIRLFVNTTSTSSFSLTLAMCKLVTTNVIFVIGCNPVCICFLSQINFQVDIYFADFQQFCPQVGEKNYDCEGHWQNAYKSSWIDVNKSGFAKCG